jgi:hypothetical protein
MYLSPAQVHREPGLLEAAHGSARDVMAPTRDWSLTSPSCASLNSRFRCTAAPSLSRCNRLFSSLRYRVALQAMLHQLIQLPLPRVPVGHVIIELQQHDTPGRGGWLGRPLPRVQIPARSLSLNSTRLSVPTSDFGSCRIHVVVQADGARQAAPGAGCPSTALIINNHATPVKHPC